MAVEPEQPAAPGGGLATSSTPHSARSPAPSSTLRVSTTSLGSACTSNASLGTVRSTQSRRDYMDSLVVPPREELRRIAKVQEDREAEHKKLSRDQRRHSIDVSAAALEPDKPPSGHQKTGSLTEKLRAGQSVDDILREKAATLIQRTYRGYRARRTLKGLSIDASMRWAHAIRDAQYREVIRPRARAELLDTSGGDSSALDEPQTAQSSESPAKRHWKKVAMIVKHAELDQDSSESEPESEPETNGLGDPQSLAQRRSTLQQETRAERQKEAKAMGLEYFLEMVDLKHRYGSNLRTYHEQWKKSDTHENFFYWLDYGEGRLLDVAGCPRERLDREQVRYLSREERQYYLAKVDKEGRLCWAKNGVRIDTTEKWKDSIHGIVPADDPTPAFVANAEMAHRRDSTTAGSD